MAGPKNNGGGNRQQGQQRQQGEQQVMGENEVTGAKQNLAAVLGGLDARRAEITAILPKDVTFDAFHVSVNQALRNNPRLLRCTTSSLINACIKAAYDGLKIDGKEAAIVDAQERYQDGNVWKSRTVARYMPMVFGLIKQILQSGMVLDVKAVIVYAAEAATGRFKLLEGTNPGIHHEPILTGDKGPMIGAYSIALLKSGPRVFEWMDAAAIDDVRKEAKTAMVWDRWPTEMWKKTVVRRHRKTLPSTRDIRDSEANEMFPQFDTQTPNPQFAMLGHNQQSSMPARPTRESIGYDPMSNGQTLDMGNDRFNGDTGDLVENDRDDRDGDRQQQQRQQEAPREQQQDRQQAEPAVEIPEDATAWAIWAADIEKAIDAAATPAAVDQVWKEAQPVLKSASKAMRDDLTKRVTDRNTSLALGDDDGGAAAD